MEVELIHLVIASGFCLKFYFLFFIPKQFPLSCHKIEIMAQLTNHYMDYKNKA